MKKTALKKRAKRLTAQTRALLIATTALAQISVGIREQAGAPRRAKIVQARAIADVALKEITMLVTVFGESRKAVKHHGH